MTSSPLLDRITAARWFGGKGRRPRLVGVTALPWMRPPGDWPAVRSEIAEIGYPDGDVEQYQLLMSYRPEHDQPDPLVVVDDADHGRLGGVDGTADPAAHAALLDLIMSRRSSIGPSTSSGPLAGSGPLIEEVPEPVEGHVVHAHPLGPTRELDLHPGMPSRVFGGEQSNTSILYGDVALLKVFRRLQPGYNPDIEIHQRLTDADNQRIARLFGWVEMVAVADPDDHTDLAMLVEQLPGASDGWELALEAVRAGQDLSIAANDLGAALATIHRDLRSQFPTDRIAGATIAEAMASRLAAAALVVPELGDVRIGLTVVFDRLRSRTIDVQRLHGDFHLGQALLTAAGWKIIDFEGEPAKPMAERLTPDSVWRDIAGALRSFDYAAAHRDDDDFAARWAAGCEHAFLAGYRMVAGGEADDHADLLAAYLADKAIYEVVYEARNRPSWLHIPLAAVVRLAAGARS